MGPVELVLDLVEALPFLGFDIPGILPGEKLQSVSVRLRSNSYRLRSANKLSGAVAGEW